MHDNIGSVTINRSTLFNTGVLPKPEFTHDDYLEFMRSGEPYTDTPIFFNKLCPFTNDYNKLFNINWKDALFHQYQVLQPALHLTSLKIHILDCLLEDHL